ncbi:MAG TPA: hypothetical protein VLE95_04880, partial [Chlamydiales bacterium]|nr:hypothetical protein [Chlamydiales bacterium]
FFGLTPWMDLNIIPQFFINSTHGKTSGGFGDFSVGLDFQLYSSTFPFWFPGIKFAVQEIFPTGVFQNFHPHLLGTDQTGAGTFGTVLQLVLYKIYQLADSYFMSLNISGTYQVNTPVEVHGYNAYGGGKGTKGRVVVGNSFECIISFEFTLNQNWVFAMDNVYTHTDASSFYGTPGTINGSPASVGLPSSEQFSFAPAIEYNFSANLGLIGGCWFSAAGRNSTRFASGVIEFVYVY